MSVGSDGETQWGVRVMCSDDEDTEGSTMVSRSSSEVKTMLIFI